MELFLPIIINRSVGRHCLLESYKHMIYVYVENTHRVDYIFTSTSTENYRRSPQNILLLNLTFLLYRIVNSYV